MEAINQSPGNQHGELYVDIKHIGLLITQIIQIIIIIILYQL
jgi:hypothetical protein